MKQAMKSGVGSYTVELPSGVLVAVLAAVNAFGDVRDPATGKIVAGARTTPDSCEFADTEQVMRARPPRGFGVRNTTLAVVATNAALTKMQARKMAQMASLALARTIYPVNTMFDGDTVFALSIGGRAADINVLGSAAAEALSAAILRAVRLAKSMGGVPGLA